MRLFFSKFVGTQFFKRFLTMNFDLNTLRARIVGKYPFGGPERLQVPKEKTDWSVEYPEYNPPYFVTEKVLSNKQWADNEERLNIKFNSIDKHVNRVSHHGKYQVDSEGRPLNPVGRTGIRGRGNLGKWGPNHAVDPIVTRWKNPVDSENSANSPRVLQFIAIERHDTGEWAIPGGMMDPGEGAADALKREFLEEVFSIDSSSAEEKEDLQTMFREMFSHGLDVYKGYVDDPRNTDNAWIETECKNFHTEDKKILELPLKAGDDAKNAKWVAISSTLRLYASHEMMVHSVAKMRNAAW